MNDKPPIQSPFAVGTRRFAAVILRLRGVSIRGRLVAWLLMSIAAYGLGLPILFSAALAGLPWLLLPSAKARPARRLKDRAARR